MTSNLECVGLGVRDRDGFVQLVQDALAAASPLGSPGGVQVLRWQDPGGARLILGLQDGELLDFLPSFAGTPGARLSNLVMVNDDVATAAVVDEDGDQLTSLALEVEQRRMLAGDQQMPCRASMIGLGVDVEVFADDAEYAAADASLLSTDQHDGEPPADYVANGWNWPPRMAAESFMSFGVFAAPQDTSAHARLAGTVLTASRRRTQLTGQDFVVARVRTVGFEVDVCLAAGEHDRLPEPGQVLAGTVFLVGDLVDVRAAGSRRPRR